MFLIQKHPRPIMGLLVAAFILAGGVSTLKDIMGPLLGQVPSKELVDEIERRMLAEPLIVGEIGRAHV